MAALGDHGCAKYPRLGVVYIGGHIDGLGMAQKAAWEDVEY